jgi:hypothetical protein
MSREQPTLIADSVSSTRWAVSVIDWTRYRLVIEAPTAALAIEQAQRLSTSEIWEADAIDGGQADWYACPLVEGDAP